MKIRFYIFLTVLFMFVVSCKKNQPKTEIAESVEIRREKPGEIRSMTGVMAKRGLITKTEQAAKGYVLFEPTHSAKSFLINRDGQVVHKWESDLYANHAYLLENGHIIRQERIFEIPTFAFGGLYGKLREFDWDGNIVWEFDYADKNNVLHHDIEVLPNGNILAIAYEVVSRKDAIAAGRNPNTVTRAGLWVDKIIEIKPNKPMGGEIVWQWRMMDHLIQDFDSTKANYGVISENPSKINFNTLGTQDMPLMSQEQFLQAKKSGRLLKNRTFENQHSEVTHANAVSYNPQLDQIALSFKYYSEIYIIDHSTTLEEAKGSIGGKYGHGGDILYRWGNPSNYGHGTIEDQKLFSQHDVKFISKGYPGEGNLLVFNNDIINPESKFDSVFEAFESVENPTPEINVSITDVGNYSAVYELNPPIAQDGSYKLSSEGTFGPQEPIWTYMAPDKYSLYSAFVSGAQRLKNGNTLITAGTIGRFFEVTPEGKTVWEYWNPYFYDYKLPDGSPPSPAGPFMYYQFKATFFDEDFNAFQDKKLQPINPQPEPFIFKMASSLIKNDSKQLHIN